MAPSCRFVMSSFSMKHIIRQRPSFVIDKPLSLGISQQYKATRRQQPYNILLTCTAIPRSKDEPGACNPDCTASRKMCRLKFLLSLEYKADRLSVRGILVIRKWDSPSRMVKPKLHFKNSEMETENNLTQVEFWYKRYHLKFSKLIWSTNHTGQGAVTSDS